MKDKDPGISPHTGVISDAPGAIRDPFYDCFGSADCIVDSAHKLGWIGCRPSPEWRNTAVIPDAPGAIRDPFCDCFGSDDCIVDSAHKLGWIGFRPSPE